MNRENLISYLKNISNIMILHESMLTEADAKFGDGDLGISMKKGFDAIYQTTLASDETDLGKIFFQCSAAFNEAAPSTLGTVLSICMMGMARKLMGQTCASLEEMANALEEGLKMITLQTKSSVGDRTIMDSLVPAVSALKEHAPDGKNIALSSAFKAAKAGMESTKDLAAKFGRMVYYGEQVLGHPDGGAITGMLIFEALAEVSDKVSF